MVVQEMRSYSLHQLALNNSSNYPMGGSSVFPYINPGSDSGSDLFFFLARKCICHFIFVSAARQITRRPWLLCAKGMLADLIFKKVTVILFKKLPNEYIAGTASHMVVPG